MSELQSKKPEPLFSVQAYLGINDGSDYGSGFADWWDGAPIEAYPNLTEREAKKLAYKLTFKWLFLNLIRYKGGRRFLIMPMKFARHPSDNVRAIDS